jgi:hypothetical protein
VRLSPSSRLAPAAVLAVHAIVFSALTWWSWGKWTDPLVDFGRELYTPWQITRGKVLDQDIATLFGPLSPYVNALWFRLFGVSLTTLVLCNIAILAATSAGIYHLLRTSSDRLTASVATLTGLLLYGFSQYLDVGNYNFVSPYSHDATHGFALGVAALVAFYQGVRTWRGWLFALSGLCFGLVLLTKPETALATAAALGMGWMVGMSIDHVDPQRVRQGVVPRVLAFSLATAVVPLVFLLYFHFGAGMSGARARAAVAGGWVTALGTPIAKNVFYARMTGLDHAATNALRMFGLFAGFCIFVGLAARLASIRPSGRLSRTLVTVAWVVLSLAAAYLVPRYEVSRALSCLASLGFVASVVLAVRSRHEPAQALALLPLVLWSTFAVVLLAKMWLNAQPYHYGFYLALPATNVTVVLLLWFLPRTLARGNPEASGRIRLVMLALIAATIAPHLALSNRWYQSKVVPIGVGHDRFLASNMRNMWQGAVVQQTLDWLEQNAPAGATLTVLPEGVMINYLARRETPARLLNFMPPEIIAFGEQAVVRSLDAHPPDFVLLVHRSTAEYGYPLFGSSPDYGRDILTWVRRHYRTAAVIGRDPMTEAGFGIEILRRAP